MRLQGVLAELPTNAMPSTIWPLSSSRESTEELAGSNSFVGCVSTATTARRGLRRQAKGRQIGAASQTNTAEEQRPSRHAVAWACARLSERSFARVWDNEEDAIYDEL